MDKFLGILRQALTLIGSFLIGHNFWGQPIDEQLWQEVLGIGLAIGGTVWSIMDKTVNEEKIQGTLRHLILFIGGLLVARGLVKPEQVELWLGLAASLVPLIYGWLSRIKSQKVVDGEILPTQLKR